MSSNFALTSQKYEVPQAAFAVSLTSSASSRESDRHLRTFTYWTYGPYPLGILIGILGQLAGGGQSATPRESLCLVSVLGHSSVAN